ncbi:MAG: SET domain-containing protein [Spirochaetes bacterium]|nr:SET domain-containing protein [Spirochaetota bacterium]
MTTAQHDPSLLFPPSVEIRNSPIEGRGVFARARIAAGVRLLEYTGEVILWADAAQDEEHFYDFELDESRVLRPRENECTAMYVNHSCDPNCETHQEGDRLFYETLREIAPGEELSVNYFVQIEGATLEEGLRDYACRCGSPACKGTMLDV